MSYRLDRGPFQNPHINYEPSILDGLQEAKQLGKEHTPMITGNLVRQSIERDNNTKQAGDTYRNFEQWEKTELISNLVNDLANCDKRIQDKMIALAEEADKDYGHHLREGLKNASKGGTSQKPLGNIAGNNASQDAIDKSHGAEPY